MLRVRQYGPVAIISRGTKEVVLKREFTQEIVEAHGIRASKEEWFFIIIPMLLVRQRQRELGGAS